MIDAIVIRNETQSTLLDVVLEVPEQTMMVRTNRILPLREYSLGFSAVRNQRAFATLTWKQGGVTVTRSVETVIPKNLETGRPSRVILQVGEEGRLTAWVEAYSRGE